MYIPKTVKLFHLNFPLYESLKLIFSITVIWRFWSILKLHPQKITPYLRTDSKLAHYKILKLFVTFRNIYLHVSTFAHVHPSSEFHP